MILGCLTQNWKFFSWGGGLAGRGTAIISQKLGSRRTSMRLLKKEVESVHRRREKERGLKMREFFGFGGFYIVPQTMSYRRLKQPEDPRVSSWVIRPDRSRPEVRPNSRVPLMPAQLFADVVVTSLVTSSPKSNPFDPTFDPC